MNSPASVLVLIFLSLTFMMSVQEKIFHWKDTISWLKTHFEATYLRNYVPTATLIMVVLELLATIFCIIGFIQLLINGSRTFGFYGAVFSCVSLLFMLAGQRLAKDYDGARTIVIYFIPALMAVYWLG